MILIKDGIERDVPRHRVAEYKAAGWTQPVKKKAPTPTATAPEAATEDLGNDISKGD